MKKKNLILLGATLGVAAIAAGAMGGIKSTRFVSAEDCAHHGNHYAAKAAKCNAAGNEEFWVCCECHSKFLTTPLTGSWTDATLSGVLEESHPAYVAPSGVHNYAPNERMIGYYECSDCGNAGSEIMSEVDIDSLNLNQFSMNSIRHASATTDTDSVNSSRVNAGALAFATSKDIYLPRVNYSLYESVAFEFSIDHYNSDSLSIDLSIGGSEFAPWSFLKGSYQYFLVASKVGDELKITLTKPGVSGSSVSVSIAATSIINGSESLVLTPTCTSSRTFYLQSILPRVSGSKFVASQISQGPNQVIDNSTAIATVGGVAGTYIKASLPESTGSYSKVSLGFPETAYSSDSALLSLKVYIDCESTDEVKSTLIFQDYQMTGWSADNPNWSIKNIDVQHNTWTYITIPSERLAHDGVLDTVRFYANGGKAARDYYVEYVGLSSAGSLSYDMINNKTIVNTNQNTCNGGTSNLGNSFTSTKHVTADNSLGLGKECVQFNLGANCTYVLDRINLVNPLVIGTRTNITFHMYYQAAATPASDLKLILCPNSGTSSSNQQTVTTGNVNKWIDVTFTNVDKCANAGLLENFNFGCWTGGFANGDSIYVSSITIS